MMAREDRRAARSEGVGADHALASSSLEAPAWDRVGGRPAAWTLAVFLLAWMMLVFTVCTTWPEQDHGTRMADSNILNAGRNFEAHGLGFHHGVPSLETYEDGEREPSLYGTYPPGAYWIHALVRGAGLEELSEVRGASVVGAGVAGVLSLLAFGVLSRSWLVGALAAGFYCFSAPFAGWADSVHMKVWMQIALLGFILAWVGFERVRGGWRWVLLGLAGAAYFADVWLNLEHVLLIAIVVAARTIMSRRWSVWVGGGVMAGVAALGIASRVWHLTLEFETLEGVREYLTRKYERRAGEEGGGADGFTIGDVVGPWLAQLWWSEAGERSKFREFGYPLLWWPVLLCGGGSLVLMVATRLRAAWRARGIGDGGAGAGAGGIVGAVWDTRVESLRGARAGLGWGVLLLLASLHWHVWMRQHASAHPHVILNMLPGMALILGSLAAGGLRLAAPDARGAGWTRWLGLPLAVGLAGAFLVHLRHTPTLNRLFPLTAMHQEMAARERGDQWWRSLGTAIAERFGPVRRVVLYHWGPRQANLLGLPHQFVEGGGMPASLGLAEGTWTPEGSAGVGTGVPRGTGEDLLLIEYPRSGKPPRVAMEEGFERFGWAEIESGPEGTALVFRAGPPAEMESEGGAAAWEAEGLDVRLAGGVRLVGLRVARTIAGDAWVVTADVRGPGGAPYVLDEEVAGGGAAGGALPARARVLLSARGGADGAIAAETSRAISAPVHRVRHESRSIMWVFLAEGALGEDGGMVRIGLVPRDIGGRVEIEGAGGLPEGMDVDLETDEIVWKVGGR